MLAGLRSLCTRGSGFVWWRNNKPVPISAAILNLSCHGIGGLFPLTNRQSSKLPFDMCSYTRQPYSGQAPRRRTISAILFCASAVSMAALDLAFSFSATANAASSASLASSNLLSSSNFQRWSSTACDALHNMSGLMFRATSSLFRLIVIN
ncbi:hypothetical protein CR513_29332, partial [Mucuna pruriens]